MAACRAQIGSISDTITRQPAWRSEAAEPLPTSPKPATMATLPAIITSVPRRMPSTSDFAAAIEIVELGLGDAVIDVDGGEQQLAVLFHQIEAMHAGGGFFRHALDAGGDLGEPALGLFLQQRA